MMNGRHVAAAAILALCLAGCADSDFAPSSNLHFRVWAGPVQVLDKPPPLNYIRIGMLTAHGGWSDSEAGMIETLKSAAAKVGANAIVLLGDRQPEGRNLLLMPQYSLSAMAIRTVR